MVQISFGSIGGKLLTFLRKHSVTLVLIGLIAFAFLRLNTLNKRMAKQRVESIMQADKIKEELQREMINSLVLRDSMLNVRIIDLKVKQNELKKDYAKINIDYGAIVIDRPEY